MAELTDYEAGVIADGRAARLLQLEDRYGSQRAALDAHPELVEVAPALQRIRAKIAANALGIELRGDGLPFPEHVLADAEIVFRRLVAARPDDANTLLGAAAAAGLAGLRDDDPADEAS